VLGGGSNALVGPIHINSAFRSRELNATIGGSPTSAHLDGYAADLVAPGSALRERSAKLLQAREYLSTSLSRKEIGSTLASVTLRQEILTAALRGWSCTLYTHGLGSNGTELAMRWRKRRKDGELTERVVRLETQMGRLVSDAESEKETRRRVADAINARFLVSDERLRM